MAIRIAILSDMHIGSTARAFDMIPGGTPEFVGEKGYLEYFESFTKSEDITADFLIVTGDITNKAQPQQFKLASLAIKKIAGYLNVSEAKIITVPGNHDLNWDVTNLSNPEDSFWRDYKFEPYIFGNREIGIADVRTRKLTEPPHFTVDEYDETDFWSFNSAAYDEPDNLPHHGRINDVYLSELECALDAKYAINDRNKLKIFVTHHHLQAQPELYDVPDFSTMVNGDKLLNLLIKYRFDIVAHGHKHRPWIKNFIEAGKERITIWCSGSFSQTLGPRFENRIGNLWHLLEIDGKDEDGKPLGKVYSWAYSPGSGWSPSKANQGIDHISPIAKVRSGHEIKTEIEKVINEKLKTESFLEWSTVQNEHAILRYQPNDVIWEQLEALEKASNISLRGDRDSLDGLIIIRSGTGTT